jgi:hypothetical protein
MFFLQEGFTIRVSKVPSFRPVASIAVKRLPTWSMKPAVS